MKAVAVFPSKKDSIRLTDLPDPGVDDIPEGRGMLVKVLRVGVDGTDKETNDAKYGAAPEGYDFLVTGHESFGRATGVGVLLEPISIVEKGIELAYEIQRCSRSGGRGAPPWLAPDRWACWRRWYSGCAVWR